MHIRAYRSVEENKPISDITTKRAHTQIIAEILEQCKQPTAKTRIMYKVSMSYPATINFLEYLQKLKMLKLDQEGKKYKTTEKGLSYLKKHSELRNLLKP